MQKKFVNFFIYGLGQSVNILSPLIVIPYLIKVCGESGLGKIGISFSFALILCCIIDYSSNLIGTRDISVNKTNKKYLKQKITDFYLAKLGVTITVLSLFLLSIYTIPFLRNEKSLYLLIIPLLIAQLLNPNWILQGLEKFKIITLTNITSKGIYLGLIFYLITNSTDYIWVNFFLGLSNCILFLLLTLIILYKIEFKITINNIKNAKNIIINDFKICISEFSLAIYQFMPIIFIGAILGNTSAGIYKVIEQIISIFRTYIFMFFSFTYPIICLDLVKNKIKGIKIWTLYHGINTILLVITCCIVYLLKNQIYSFFQLNNNIELIDNLLKISLFIPILIAISQALRLLTFGLELIRPYTLIIYLSIILNIILLYTILPILNLQGALYSTIFIEFLVIGAYTFFIYRDVKYNLTL